jgi:nicotinate-nucleotide adenylyltransferase
MKIGLYFGTFNPIHIGHLVIANYMVEYTDLDEVWLVVSPQNPLKNKSTLLSDIHRLAIVRVAIEDNPKLKACDIEFKLPKPSYTATTLAYLAEKYPKNEFSLIMGEDNLRTLHKWFNYEVILKNYSFYVYPRVLTEQEEIDVNKTIEEQKVNEFGKLPNVHICNEAPIMKISATFIRNAIKQGKDIRYLLTEPVRKYIDEMNFYKG